MFTYLIHTVDEKKMTSLAGDMSYYMEFAKEIQFTQPATVAVKD